MIETVEKTFSFAEFELDTAKRRLLKDGQTVALNPKAFDLLAVLVKNHGQVLNKEELLETVWANQFVEENNLTVHISALRKIFGEQKGEHQFIVTIPGKGYKFVAEIKQPLEKPENNFENPPLENVHAINQFALTAPDNRQTSLSIGQFDRKDAADTLIGRNLEINQISSLLKGESLNLLTLTGAGGAGKTSLARKVGGDLRAEFADGVFFVELAAVRAAELVAPTIMQTLGTNEANNQSYLETLKNFLRTRQILLILDNFEQIADAAAPLVGELLESSFNLKILITSRVALHLQNETEFAVEPLRVPPNNINFSSENLSDYSAVELFLNRAKNVRPNFTLNAKNAEAVAGICRRLDGLPLAVELAAARVKLLSPESIFIRLENSLNLLTGNASAYFQRTMRETIQWSYDLLDKTEQILFCRLAVFAGGFTIEAAEAVCENCELPITNDETANSASRKPQLKIQILDLLDSLINNNLLAIKQQTDGNVRLRMLEVVREFAAEMLEESGEIESLKQNHANYFLSLAEKAEMFLSGEIGSEWLEKLENDHDNLRSALSWSLKNDVQTAARIAAALRFFWSSHGHLREGLDWSKAALEATENNFSPARSKLLLSNGLFLRNSGDLEAARKIYRKTLTESRELNDLSQIIKANHGLGAIAVLQRDFAAAQIFIEEALAISRQTHDEMQIAYSLCSLGDLEMSRQNLPAARPMLEECRQIAQKIGNERLLTVTYFNLGTLDYFENEHDAAALKFAESLRIADEMGNKTMISCALDGFAAIAAERGNAKQAVYFAGAAETLRESIGYQIEPAEEIFRGQYLEKIRRALGENAFAALYGQGRAMNSDKIVKQLLSAKMPTASENYENKLIPADTHFAEIIIEHHKIERITIDEEFEPD